jgi:hypothetical protein
MKVVKANTSFKNWYRKWYGLEAEKIIFCDNNIYNLYKKLLVKQKS